MKPVTFGLLVAYCATKSCQDWALHTTVDTLYGLVEDCIPVSPPVNSQEVINLLKALAGSRKIEAIKIFRDLTGYGLKESKDAVEAAIEGAHKYVVAKVVSWDTPKVPF